MENKTSSESPLSATAATADIAPAARPMRELLRQLQQLPPSGRAAASFRAADRQLAEQLAANAETTMRAIHLGLGAMGHLIARTSVDVENGTVPAECVANLGFLMAELGDLAAECLWLTTQCRSAAPTRRSGSARASGE